MIDAELVREIEPNLQQAYEDHMASIANRDSGKPDRRPFSPTDHIAQVAGTLPDPIEFNPVIRENHQAFIDEKEHELGVDMRDILAAVWIIDLLTEDNLPHYTSRILSKSTESAALTEFGHEWTAEEAMHSILMRGYAEGAGIIGPAGQAIISTQTYHAGLVQQLRTGTEINPADLQHAFAYLPLQEDLTREAHFKSGLLLGEMGRKIMAPIPGDEQNHHEYYLKGAEASLAVDPDGTLVAMSNVYKEFDMPGKDGIPNFRELAKRVEWSGIFNVETVFRSMQKIINKLEVATAEPTTDAGKAAKDNLLVIASDETITAMQQASENERDQSIPERTERGLLPFVLGKTVDFEYKGGGATVVNGEVMELPKRPVGLVRIAA